MTPCVLCVQTDKWSFATRRPQHACFTTSNNMYGLKSPVKADMPMSWHGAKGDFTNTFAEGKPVRHGGLRCGVEHSRVHSKYDEL
jgi:Domain of unknown function (DUF4490)